MLAVSLVPYVTVRSVIYQLKLQTYVVDTLSHPAIFFFKIWNSSVLTDENIWYLIFSNFLNNCLTS
jgi:hypothetical protein